LQHHPQHRYQSAAEVLAILPTSSKYPLPDNSVPTLIVNPATPITHANKISQLKTIEISPQSPASVSTLPTQLPARDPNEWKKPAWQVTKVMSGVLVTCLLISSFVKWVGSLDPIGAFNKQINNATAGIVNAVPNPFKSQPSVQQRQQDLTQKLKQANIPPAKFYRQVDRLFYAKHPELNGRSLTAKSTDEKLRQEWQDTAVQLLDKLTSQ
jgi:hypothetical protein